MKIICLEETDSTNNYASAHADELEPWSIVLTESQTKGRGQRGNSWEAEPGKNLTFSMVIKPENFRARDQFALSEAVALATVETLKEEGIEACVKWPNDIYVGDRKIAGLLLEHSVTGMFITHTVAGIGLNVNQTEFLSDAPNPVSMSMITGREYDLNSILEKLGSGISRKIGEAFDQEGRRRLHETFKSSLWRGDGGRYPFRLPDGTEFEAIIRDVEETGYLILGDEEGNEKKFAFKEVNFCLPDTINVSVDVNKYKH